MFVINCIIKNMKIKSEITNVTSQVIDISCIVYYDSMYKYRRTCRIL